MAVLGSLRTALAAYEACAVDVYRAFRGSWFVGLLLAAFYLFAFICGLLFGALLYELLEPVLVAIGFVLGFPADIALEIAVLLILLYAASSIFCLAARLLVQGVTYLLFEMRGDALFYLLIAVAMLSAVVLVFAALLPPVVPESSLVTASGLSAVSAVLAVCLCVWMYVRYRWGLHPQRHTFDRDIGLAWSHMSDPRRARFGFDGRGL